MDNFETGFGNATFDLITNRHADFSDLEVDRILKLGGTFITQQVGRNNTLNVLDAFNWTPDSFGPGYWGPSWEEASLPGTALFAAARQNGDYSYVRHLKKSLIHENGHVH